ncbi:MAG TPA: PepSY domain-containing protein [Roseateles sp.]|uniref:PepSY domain-containing protein n=1 Tax=Roseateles sp. TaxID=1971397 RepID=UPI002ED8F2EB
MKRLLTTLALVVTAGSAFAHGAVSCPVVPKEEKRGQMELQKKLESEGWKVRKVQNYNNCYEVYGFDGQGKKAEAFFHPKTFERVYPEGEQPADKK